MREVSSSSTSRAVRLRVSMCEPRISFLANGSAGSREETAACRVESASSMDLSAVQTKRNPALWRGRVSNVRCLDGYGGRDEAELAHLVEQVEVDPSLGDLSVLDLQNLGARADDLLVGRLDVAVQALERAGVGTLHDDFLDDPGGADDLVAYGHLAVREALEPRHRVLSCVLGVVRLEPAGGLELDVVGVKREQRPLVMSVESGDETSGCVFDISHVFSS